MAPHSSTLAWKIPWVEEPGRLQSMGSLRVGHDWASSLSLFTFMHWRRKWQPTPVFLPGKSHGWRSLVGYSPWGHKELDTTEHLHFHFHFFPSISIVLNKIFLVCWTFLMQFFTDVPLGSMSLDRTNVWSLTIFMGRGRITSYLDSDCKQILGT